MDNPSLDNTKKKSAMTLLAALIILGSIATSPIAMQMRQASAQATEPTFLYLDPQTGIKGQEVIVRGFLIDNPVDQMPLINQTIRFELTGLNGGSPVTTSDPVVTSSFGTFTANFTAPSEAGYWNLTAYFDGNGTYLASSDSAKFATAEPNAMEFDVTTSSGTDFTLTGFDFEATVNIDPVPSDYLAEPVTMLVSQCTSPDPQGKYLPLSFDTANNTGNICLEIFPGSLLQIDNQPKVKANISYAGIETLPSGYNENNIDLFHYDPFTGEITEITASRNVGSQHISGTSLGVGRFIVGIGLHGEAPDGVVRQHVFIGDDQQVMFRDVTNQANTTATVVSTSPEEITLEEPVTITLNYTNGNLDINAIDKLTVQINSTSSTPDYVTIVFTENATNSGIFTGSLTLTSGSTLGSSLHANNTDTLSFTIVGKDSTDARFKAILDGVSEAGVIDLSDYEITEAELDDLAINEGFVPIVGPINMTLVDASLDEFTGKVHVTMSYANSLIGPNDPTVLKIFHKPPASGWDITPPAATLDAANRQVSATFNIADITTPGLFALGFSGGSPGGAGGGLGKPGVGVVLDFLVPFATPPPGPSPPPPNEDNGNDNTSSSSGTPSSGSSRTVVITDEQTNTYPPSYFETFPLAKMLVTNTALVNAAGDSIPQTSAGQQVSIASTFTNQQQVSQNYAFIVLILDQDGVAIDVSWQEGTAAGGQTVELSSTWMPKDSGMYTFKIFVWDGLDNPLPLSTGAVRNINVNG